MIGKQNSLVTLFAIALCVLLLFCGATVQAQNGSVGGGLFEGHSDVGPVLHAGSVEYDSAKQAYTVSGSGDDMWADDDEFHFVWKKMSDDVSLTADIAFANLEGNAHKKAVLMFRQGLDKDSAYVDVALHASGLTSLQYRETKGGDSHEIQAKMSAPARLRLVKRGDYVVSLFGRGRRRIPGNGRFHPAAVAGAVLCRDSGSAVITRKR